MKQQIELQVKLPFRLRWDGDLCVAWCPVLDVSSQGDSEQEAVKSLREAVMLFLETCIEMGTLDAMLREAGFHTVAVESHKPHKPEEHWLDVPLELISDKNNRTNAENQTC